jgi:hypothetical protein
VAPIEAHQYGAQGGPCGEPSCPCTGITKAAASGDGSSGPEASIERRVLDDVRSHWFVQGGHAEFGPIGEEHASADEVVSAILSAVRSSRALAEQPSEKERTDHLDWQDTRATVRAIVEGLPQWDHYEGGRVVNLTAVLLAIGASDRKAQPSEPTGLRALRAEIKKRGLHITDTWVAERLDQLLTASAPREEDGLREKVTRDQFFAALHKASAGMRARRIS